ncbi:MAG: cytochrome c biogenesis protein CcsA [Chitinophagales bacterium]
MNEMVEGQAVNPIFGQVGHLLVILSFVSVLLACISYYLSNKTTDAKEKTNWIKFARILFFVHVFSIAGVLVTLLSMISGHHFEYYYVWQHSSLDLQQKYILSCLWEGQEGSFLLWCFWHTVLGSILVYTSAKWEPGVMIIITGIQIFLTSFLLGFHFGDFHIGSSPFLLLEDELTKDPVFLFSNYMKYIPDGTGLNALLQNYWMVIHPPVLFLGFASCSVPFAFAMAGLLQKDFTGWLKPGIAWSCFAAGILGTGVLMGGAWAYEALSFGGFWAWDPVENASIMPWLVLVGGLHTMVIAKATGHALKSTYIFIILTFLFVLYASFLTRSGILGDTSVHSFVTSGLTGHLLLFFFSFIAVSIILYRSNVKSLPVIKKEEAGSSREFWMFIGSLILLFSCLHIVVFTSIPVYNEIFNGFMSLIGVEREIKLSPPTDPIHYYTSVQIWIAIIIALLFAFVQYLKYSKTDLKMLWKQINITIFSSLVLAVISSFALQYPVFHTYTLLLFASWFAILGNLQYIMSVLKGKIKVSGASVTHTGFAILLLGILISNANQQVISLNTDGIRYGKGFDSKATKENILLEKGIPKSMGDYIVTYAGDTTIERETTFTVKYEKVNPETGEVENTFNLHPYLLLDKKSENLSPNPDTKHYLDHDVFTHISSFYKADTGEAERKNDYTLELGDTIALTKGLIVLTKINKYNEDGNIAVGAEFILHKADSIINVEPRLVIVNNQLLSEPVEIPGAEITLTFDNILPETEQFVFTVTDKTPQKDFIILKAILFPLINLVWLGSVIMAMGFFLSMYRRIRENKITEKNAV